MKRQWRMRTSIWPLGMDTENCYTPLEGRISILCRSQVRQWIPLKVLNESNPVEVANYVMSNRLINKPAIKWQAPYTLRKRHHIVSNVVCRVKKEAHKYGIRIPRSIQTETVIGAISLKRKWEIYLWPLRFLRMMKHYRKDTSQHYTI